MNVLDLVREQGINVKDLTIPERPPKSDLPFDLDFYTSRINKELINSSDPQHMIDVYILGLRKFTEADRSVLKRRILEYKNENQDYEYMKYLLTLRFIFHEKEEYPDYTDKIRDSIPKLHARIGTNLTPIYLKMIRPNEIMPQPIQNEAEFTKELAKDKLIFQARNLAYIRLTDPDFYNKLDIVSNEWWEKIRKVLLFWERNQPGYADLLFLSSSDK